MTQLFANNASSSITALIAIGATSFTVGTGTGAKFPDPTAPDYFLVTLHTADYAEWEIVKCTARSGDVFTIERGWEGTAQEWPLGTLVAANLTKDTMDQIITASDAAYQLGLVAQQDAYAATQIAQSQIIGYEAQANAGEFNQPYLGPSTTQNHHGLLQVYPASGATFSADYSDVSEIWVELDQACTITPTGFDWQNGVPKALVRHRLIINTNTFAVTWGGSIVWISGAPTLANNTTSIIEFWSPDDGTTIIGEIIADGLTEITQPEEARFAFLLGGYDSLTTLQTMVKFNIWTETYHINEYGLLYSAENPRGAASDYTSYGWYHRGTEEFGTFAKINFITSASQNETRSTGSHAADHREGSPCSPYDTASGNTKALIAFGENSAGTASANLTKLDMVNTSYSTGSINYAYSKLSGATATDGSEYGMFVGDNNRYELPWSTLVSVSSYNASYSYDQCGMGNDQSSKAVFWGGKLLTNPISNSYAHDFTTKAWTTAGAMATNRDARFGFGSTPTYGYLCADAFTSSVKCTFSTTARAVGPYNSKCPVDCATFMDFNRN